MFGNSINRVYLGWKQNKHGLYGLETDETEFEWCKILYETNGNPNDKKGFKKRAYCWIGLRLYMSVW